jgi:alkylation response protein AidB-like acyl-CoA dehydrogenase
MAAIPTTEELLASVERIRPIIERHADQAEAERRLPHAVYAAMIDAGLVRMTVSKKAGGYEYHPCEAFRVWEAVSRIDSAAGWSLQIAAAAGAAAPMLPQEGADEVLRDHGADTIVAVPFFPMMAATRVDGGFRVTGHGRIASGANRADWIFLTCIEMEGEGPKIDPATGGPTPMIAAVRPTEVRVLDTWRTMGMRGTGSNDVVADAVFVPARRVGIVGGPLNSYATPIGGAFFFLGTHSETVVSLGVAGAAIDRFLEIAKTKVPNGQTLPVRERAMAQHHAAKARGLLDASRATLHAAMHRIYAEGQSGPISTDTRIAGVTAACFAAEACAEAVRLVHEAAGTSGVFLDDHLERHLRDAMTLTQHTSKSYARYEDAGKVMMGVPSDWPAFVL